MITQYPGAKAFDFMHSQSNLFKKIPDSHALMQENQRHANCTACSSLTRFCAQKLPGLLQVKDNMLSNSENSVRGHVEPLCNLFRRTWIMSTLRDNREGRSNCIQPSMHGFMKLSLDVSLEVINLKLDRIHELALFYQTVVLNIALRSLSWILIELLKALGGDATLRQRFASRVLEDLTADLLRIL